MKAGFDGVTSICADVTGSGGLVTLKSSTFSASTYSNRATFHRVSNTSTFKISVTSQSGKIYWITTIPTSQGNYLGTTSTYNDATAWWVGEDTHAGTYWFIDPAIPNNGFWSLEYDRGPNVTVGGNGCFTVVLQ